MNDEIEFYINENGIACVPLRLYNDSLEEIERLNNIINELEKWIEKNKQWQIFSEKYIVWEDKLTEKINELKGDSSNE